MALIKSVKGIYPKMGIGCWLAENCTIVGEVEMGNNCSVWFNAVIRGDVNSIVIGDNTNIQDGAIIHCTYQKYKTIIGSNVSIGHNAIVHGCTLEDNLLIGMGAIVMDGAIVQKESIVAGGSSSFRKYSGRKWLYLCGCSCKKNKTYRRRTEKDI